MKNKKLVLFLSIGVCFLISCGGSQGPSQTDSTAMTEDSSLQGQQEQMQPAKYLGSHTLKVNVGSEKEQRFVSFDQDSKSLGVFMKQELSEDTYVGISFEKDPGEIEVKLQDEVLQTVKQEDGTLSIFIPKEKLSENNTMTLSRLGESVSFVIGRDSQKPEIVEALTLKQSEITLGEKIEVSLKVKDEGGSGLAIYRQQQTYENIRGGIFTAGEKTLGSMPLKIPGPYIPGLSRPRLDAIISFRVDSENEDGSVTLKGEYQTYPWDKAGDYGFEQLAIHDRVGNLLLIQKDALPTVRVNAASGQGQDTTAPEIVEALTLNKSEITLGEKIEVSLKVKDEGGSGLAIYRAQAYESMREGVVKAQEKRFGSIRLCTPDCFWWISFRVDSENEDGSVTLKGEYQTYPWDKAGDYRFEKIIIYDQAGNERLIDDASHFPKVKVSAASGQGPDATAPEVVEGRILNRSEITLGEKIEFILKVKDEGGSGLRSYIQNLDDDSPREGFWKAKEERIYAMQLCAPDCPQNLWSVSFRIESKNADGSVTLKGEYQTYLSDKAGEYHFQNLRIYDRAGNERFDDANNFPTIEVNPPTFPQD